MDNEMPIVNKLILLLRKEKLILQDNISDRKIEIIIG